MKMLKRAGAAFTLAVCLAPGWPSTVRQKQRSPSAAAAAPTEMHAILLGTGFPRPFPDRAGPSTAIVVGDEVFLVDAGRGATLRFAATGLLLSAIRAVFLTHLHSDHIDGLPDVFHSTWEFGRVTPFELYGPEGTQSLADGMMKFYDADIHIRRDLTELLPAAGATIETHIVHEGVVYEDARVRVTAFNVDHRPVEPAFGYRFDCAGKIIVISGDTRPSDNLIRHAKGADILIHEAYLPEYFDRVDNKQVAATLKHYHTSADEAGQVAEAAGVKMLVLTHLIPPDADQEFLDRAGKYFHGKIVVGRDLMKF